MSTHTPALPEAVANVQQIRLLARDCTLLRQTVIFALARLENMTTLQFGAGGDQEIRAALEEVLSLTGKE